MVNYYKNTLTVFTGKVFIAFKKFKSAIRHFPKEYLLAPNQLPQFFLHAKKQEIRLWF